MSEGREGPSVPVMDRPKDSPFQATEKPGATPEQNAARKTAATLLDKQRQAVDAKIRNSTPDTRFTPGEEALYAAASLEEGFGDDAYNRGPISMQELNPKGELDVETADGKKITVTGIQSEKVDKDGNLIYVCEFGIDKKTAEVPANNVVQAFVAENATTIATTIDNPKERALVEWYAKGGEGDVPITTDQVTEAGREVPVKEQSSLIDFLGQQILALDSEIQGLEVGNPRRDQLIKLVREVRGAVMAEGSTGIFYKKQALERLKVQMATDGKTDMMATINGQIDTNVTPHLDQAKEELKDFLEDKPEKTGRIRIKNKEGIRDDQLKEWLEMIDKGDIMGVLNSKDFIKLDEASQLVYGEGGLTPQKAEAFINNCYLSDEQKRGFIDYAKSTGKWGAIILAILAGIPIALTIAATGMASGRQ